MSDNATAGEQASGNIGQRPEDVVGDKKRASIISIDPNTGKDRAIVGEVWQDESGKLHGKGVAAVMLFEPSSSYAYTRAGTSLDISPLSVFSARITRSPLYRIKFMEQ